jgi:hypothetical protein
MGGVTPDWLSQLAPAHAPPAAGWWPLAPGWWIILIILVLIASIAIYWQRRTDVRLRRIALRELESLHDTIQEDSVFARELEHLLRRYALARFGRDSVAALSGERWLAFVVEHGGVALSGPGGASLLRTAYGGSTNAHRALWLSGAQSFIKSRT